MRIVRAVVLAVIASLMLFGGTASPAVATPDASASAADAGGNGSADPGDPGFPPDN